MSRRYQLKARLVVDSTYLRFQTYRKVTALDEVALRRLSHPVGGVAPSCHRLADRRLNKAGVLKAKRAER